MKRRPNTSQQWMEMQKADPFVQQAKAEGYRSRAVYKLKEVDKQHHLIRPGMTVLELGAAPGGWTQYVVERLKGTGHVWAIDCLSMPAVPGATFIQGDLTEDSVQNRLMAQLEGQKVDLLLSDMAPNLSGVKGLDGIRTGALAETVLEVMALFLKPGGTLFMKTFHGAGFDDLVKQTRKLFKRVILRKPEASRSHSRETYLLGIGLIHDFDLDGH